MPVIQTIVVDMSTRGLNPVAYSHQNDDFRTFHFEMKNNGEDVDLTGWSCKIGAILPGNEGGYRVIAGEEMADASIDGNIVSATLGSPYTDKAGNGVLTLIFTTPLDYTIRPINVDFRIQESADGEDVIAGASDFVPVLEQYMSESMAQYIDAWLDDHPEATTTVQDHSLTANKLVVGTLGYVTPEMFGAVGDGTTDDVVAIQSAINSGLPVVLNNNAVYNCSSSFSLVSGLNMCARSKATIAFEDVSVSALVNGSQLENIKLENIVFDFGTQTASKYGLSILNSDNITVKNCEIKNGLGYATRLNESTNMTFEGCYFHDINGTSGNPGGAIYGQNMKDVIIKNCVCEDIDDHFAYIAGVTLCSNIVIDGNIVKNSGSAALTAGAAITVYANSKNITIVNNILTGCRTGIQVSNYGEYTTVPTDIIISNNKIDDSVLDGMSIIGLTTAYIERLYCSNNVINNSGQDGAHFRYCKNISINNISVNEATRNGIEWSAVNYSTLANIIVNNADDDGIILGNSAACDYNSLSNLTVQHNDNGTQGIYLRLGTGNKLVSYFATGYSVNFANSMTNTVIINDTLGKWASNEQQALTGTTISYAPTRDGFVTAENDCSDSGVRYIVVQDTTLGRTVGSGYSSGGVRTSVTFFVIAGHTYTIARNESVKSLNVMFNSLY